MRNISQIIFNYNNMEKIIKTLPELKSLEKWESDHRETDLFSELYITHTLEHIAKL